ncbi:hypothetical protein HMPREF3033_01639 [Veillonellaceae bacterium DNF00751]|nr:hypothetical protein HMPREF3033_01639 [Veillonellaceae bacterium DNF00751]
MRFLRSACRSRRVPCCGVLEGAEQNTYSPVFCFFFRPVCARINK